MLKILKDLVTSDTGNYFSTDKQKLDHIIR